MNAKSRIALLSLPVMLLSACTTMDERASTRPSLDSMTPQERYVAEVERIARIRGIEVVWVNPPEATKQLVARSDD